MVTVLNLNKSRRGAFGRGSSRIKPKAMAFNFRVFCADKKAGRKNFSEPSNASSVNAGFAKVAFILAVIIIFFGAVYLYQVNDLANKGYEVRAIEKQIEELKKSNEKNKIKETELKSMYNIEKNTQELDLVHSENVSYLEIGGPVAMNK